MNDMWRDGQPVNMLKLVIAAVVLAHGVGHILFLGPALRVTTWADQTGHSWLVTPLLGDGVTRAFAAIVWTSTIALFVAAVVGFFMGTDWWRGAAVLGAVISAAGIIVMWDGLAPSSAIAALVFDLIVLVALLWAHWPSTELAGQ